jgi:2-polyprenyl-3-methyl-5-hydroxy-6-metoxy-1,4-benzoquinol methylase
MAILYSNHTEWENRSIQYGMSLKSVLFKGLPNIVNEHISSWHIRFILNNITRKEGLRILDIGCGYGRLSLPVIEKFPNAEIIGIDVSKNFVDLFKKVTRQSSFVGTIEDIPADIGKFDYIICVTVLMYVEKSKLEKAVGNLISLLKPEGQLIIIENSWAGVLLSSGFGLYNCLKKFYKKEPINTGGHYFKKNEIENLVQKCHAVTFKKCGFSFTTFFILPVVILCKFFPKYFFIQSILKALLWLDERFDKLKLVSLHIGYIVKK